MFKCEFMRNILFGYPFDVEGREKVELQDNIEGVTFVCDPKIWITNASITNKILDFALFNLLYYMNFYVGLQQIINKEV